MTADVLALRRPLRAAVLALNSQYVHSSLAPWCLCAGVPAFSRLNHSASVLEGTVNESLHTVADRVTAAAPQVLGFCCYIWNIKAIKKLLPLLRAALPDCVFVLGGPEVSFCPEEALSALPGADFLISGEGERPFALLLDALAGEGSLEAVPGLCWRQKQAEGFRLSPPHAHAQMPPSPYTPAYFSQLAGRIAYIEASRGCPFACAFCLSGREGLRPQRAPLERVFSELDALAHSGARTIKFVDRTFNVNRNRADAILGYLINKSAAYPPGITFHFEIAGDILAASTLALIASAPPGLFQFEIGLQSMDEATLLRVRLAVAGLAQRTAVAQLILQFRVVLPVFDVVRHLGRRPLAVSRAFLAQISCLPQHLGAPVPVAPRGIVIIVRHGFSFCVAPRAPPLPISHGTLSLHRLGELPANPVFPTEKGRTRQVSDL